MRRPAPWPDRSGPITIERVERATEFAAYVVEKYGDQYAPILTQLRVDLEEMRREQPLVGRSEPKPPRPLPDRSEITDDMPLQLEAAARLAFPDGTMSALGLRNAATRRELEHEKLGGRIYTTLAWIREWRERNRYPARPQDQLPRFQADAEAEGRADAVRKLVERRTKNLKK
ncbi:hypothetical protein [Methylobacterium sp. SD21]|uniref:hypothetical protein n=1 Tax=Methylobacterium litchii TaxID=3138810 RepID=UPI00313B4065